MKDMNKVIDQVYKIRRIIAERRGNYQFVLEMILVEGFSSLRNRCQSMSEKKAKRCLKKIDELMEIMQEGNNE